MYKVVNHLVASAILASMFPFVAENAVARGFGKLVLQKVLRAGGVRINSTRSNSSGSNSGRILSKQELRLCLGRQADIDTATDKLEAQESALSSTPNIDLLDIKINQASREIDRLESRIETTKPLVNVYDEESVNGYNSMVQEFEIKRKKHNAFINEHRNLVDKYNKKASIHNSELEKYKQAISDFNEECTHSYRANDMNAILAEKKSEAQQ